MSIKKKMGRPLKVIDEKLVRALAHVHCTMEEIASACNCSVDTLENRFSDAIKQERNIGKSSLRKKQFELAIAGSERLLMWLGRCWLGQSDREVTENEIKELLIKIHPSRLNEPEE